jgi:hypothetical protein
MNGGKHSERQAADDAHGRDARMTAERDEVKYLVAHSDLAHVSAELARRLPHHRFTGQGANLLPKPQHFVTTVYFDTASRHQYRAARAHAGHNLKLRAKEYYDMHPSLAELATDPSQIVRYSPVLWLELKAKDGTQTSKQRIGIPKRDVSTFFARTQITPEMIALTQPTHGAEGERVLQEIARYCSRFGEPMQASCLVNYRRLPWQSEAGDLRVTLDVDLAFFPAPADLWQRRSALVRETLGTPAAREPGGVLEVKALGAVPAWLTTLLGERTAGQSPFSKFEAASAAVHGELEKIEAD